MTETPTTDQFKTKDVGFDELINCSTEPVYASLNQILHIGLGGDLKSKYSTLTLGVAHAFASKAVHFAPLASSCGVQAHQPGCQGQFLFSASCVLLDAHPPSGRLGILQACDLKSQLKVSRKGWQQLLVWASQEVVADHKVNLGY